MKKNGRAMKHMTTVLALFAVAGAMVLTAAPRAGADEPEPWHLSEARLSVQQSSLPREAKLDILTKADRAIAAGIPAEDVAVIISRGLNQGVESARISGFLETAAQVKGQNLPVRLVLDRIEQGLAKGVPAERISEVSKRLSENLAVAKPMMNRLESGTMKSTRGESPDDAIETVARALEKSIPVDAIMRTGEKVRERKESVALFSRAIDTMTTFVGSGMTADQASRLVHTAVDKGYSERDLASMERYLVNELRNGHRVNDVISSMASRMERGEMHKGREMPGGGPMRGPGSGMGGSRR
jgi:hypothetical protein